MPEQGKEIIQRGRIVEVIPVEGEERAISLVRRALGTLFLTEGVFKENGQIEIEKGRYWLVTDFGRYGAVIATLNTEEVIDGESDFYLVPSSWVNDIST